MSDFAQTSRTIATYTAEVRDADGLIEVDQVVWTAGTPDLVITDSDEDALTADVSALAIAPVEVGLTFACRRVSDGLAITKSVTVGITMADGPAAPIVTITKGPESPMPVLSSASAARARSAKRSSPNG